MVVESKASRAIEPSVASPSQMIMLLIEGDRHPERAVGSITRLLACVPTLSMFMLIASIKAASPSASVPEEAGFKTAVVREEHSANAWELIVSAP